MPSSIWYSHLTVVGADKAGHLPGSISQDTICVDKAGNDSETPWHIGGKNQQQIWLEIEVLCKK